MTHFKLAKITGKQCIDNKNSFEVITETAISLLVLHYKRYSILLNTIFFKQDNHASKLTVIVKGYTVKYDTRDTLYQLMLSFLHNLSFSKSTLAHKFKWKTVYF